MSFAGKAKFANSDKVMEFDKNIDKIQISMTKVEVIDILGEPLNSVDEVLYYVNPDAPPRVGHTTVVYKIFFKNNCVARIVETPGIDMTGNKAR
jgi:hypothetical protein